MARADLGNVWVAATESGPVTVASAIAHWVLPEHVTQLPLKTFVKKS